MIRKVFDSFNFKKLPSNSNTFYPRLVREIKDRRLLIRYSLPLFSTLLGGIIKLFLISTIHWPEQSLVLSTAVITISAWYGGFGPGVLATILNYFLLDYFFITPNVLLVANSLQENLRIFIFLLEGVGISWLSESLHRARRKAEQDAIRIFRSEQFFRSLVENVKDYAIFMLDSKGLIISWNQGATSITGFQAGEVEGRNISRLVSPNELKPKMPINFLKLSKKKGRYESEDWKIRRDGSKFWANMVITPLYDDRKYFLGFSVIIRDLSRRKKIEDLKSEFLSVAAHELNTPISIAKVICETLIRKFNKNRDLRPSLIDLQDLDSELNRLAMLINDLLDISRIETEKMTLNSEEGDISKLIKEVISKMGKITGNNHITYQNKSKIWANFDSIRIEQVLINLISNAIKYSDSESPVIINTSLSDHQVTISVKDSGKGIPKNQLSHIFEQYYQGDIASNRGFGLGLYISKKIIDLHKGKIRVESEEGKGSVISFSLPLI